MYSKFEKTIPTMILSLLTVITCVIFVSSVSQSYVGTEEESLCGSYIEIPEKNMEEKEGEGLEFQTNKSFSNLPIQLFDASPDEPESFVSLGTFMLTAYCPCRECCGEWAENRPVDEYGNTIVYTSSGAVATVGRTVAADTSILPFGTIIYINGIEYEVQDEGGAVIGNHIDIYFEDHDEALDFSLQYAEILIKGQE